VWYKNIAGRFFGLVTKHACDRRTDGQNYDSQDRASIAASRGKNGCYGNIPRTSKSAMSSSYSLTPKTHTYRIKQRVARYHTTEVIAHRKAKRGCHGKVP